MYTLFPLLDLSHHNRSWLLIGVSFYFCTEVATHSFNFTLEGDFNSTIYDNITDDPECEDSKSEIQKMIGFLKKAVSPVLIVTSRPESKGYQLLSLNSMWTDFYIADE